jgi:hypothetical protein
MKVNLPPLMRHRAVLKWLTSYGFSKNTVRDLVRRRQFCGKALRRGGRAWYSPRQICTELREHRFEEIEIEILYPEDPGPFRPFGTTEAFIPYGILREWLGQWGLPECEVRALINSGRIRAASEPNSWRRFSVAQIKRDVLRGFTETRRSKQVYKQRKSSSRVIKS